MDFRGHINWLYKKMNHMYGKNAHIHMDSLRSTYDINKQSFFVQVYNKNRPLLSEIKKELLKSGYVEENDNLVYVDNNNIKHYVSIDVLENNKFWFFVGTMK